MEPLPLTASNGRSWSFLNDLANGIELWEINLYLDLRQAILIYNTLEDGCTNYICPSFLLLGFVGIWSKINQHCKNF